MKTLRKTLQSVTELAVLPEVYHDDLKSTLKCDEDTLRVNGQLYASILVNELEKNGLNLIFINCYLHQRYAAKEFREMHLFLMMMLVCVGYKPPYYLVVIGHFDDLLVPFMDEMMGCFDDFLFDADYLEEDDEEC